MNPSDPRNRPPVQQHWAPQPQGPSQQGPNGYPQGYPVQGQYPQQQYPQTPRYGQGPAAPGPHLGKSGTGAGTVIAILVAILVFIGGAGAGAYFLFGGSTGLADDVDQSAALTVKINALLSAVKTGDGEKVEDPLLDLMVLPEKGEIWFKESFGPKDGKALYDVWNSETFGDLPGLVNPYKEAVRKGQTEIRVTRLATPVEAQRCPLPFCIAHRGSHFKIFTAMKIPRALYIVRFSKPGSAQGGMDENELYYFAIVNGRFAFIGMLYPVAP